MCPQIHVVERPLATVGSMDQRDPGLHQEVQERFLDKSQQRGPPDEPQALPIAAHLHHVMYLSVLHCMKTFLQQKSIV
jgi:hypothetical protein